MSSDLDRALIMFSALGLGPSPELTMATIPGAPWSKSRPRFSKTGKTYADPADQDAETRTGWYLKRAVKTPLTGNVGIACIFFRPNRQRIDTDNLIKHICDAGNGILWHDDSQCTAVMGVIELDPANPRTVVVLGKHQSTLTRGTDAVYPCAVCTKPISIIGQTAGPDDRRQTCSRECASRLKGYTPLSEPVPCTHCGQGFVRTTTAQKMCSPECRKENLRGVRRAAATPFSVCTGCGTTLTHRRGGQCRDCWRTSRIGVPIGRPAKRTTHA